MGRKNLVYNFKPIVGGDMSQASIKGIFSDISQFDIVTYDFSWSAGQSINGNIGIEYSRDGLTWIELDFATVINTNGAAGEHTLIIDEVGFQFTRPFYKQVNGASSGLLNVSVFCTTRGA